MWFKASPRYFKQYGAEASGSLIHPHMQRLSVIQGPYLASFFILYIYIYIGPV